ncbi:MAG: hypothetical protein KAR40_07410 [Candidatus Sabulitectum sp.]|nr:hypothetical protein [Candidatus Sabulitectum sp.]
MKRLDLNKYSGLFSGYTELRVQENRNNVIAMVDGSIMSNGRSAASGVSARSYRSGSWGFASSPEIGSDAIKHVIKAASDNALFLQKHPGRGEPDLPVSAAAGQWDYSTEKLHAQQGVSSGIRSGTRRQWRFFRCGQEQLLHRER